MSSTNSLLDDIDYTDESSISESRDDHNCDEYLEYTSISGLYACSVCGSLCDRQGN